MNSSVVSGGHRDDTPADVAQRKANALKKQAIQSLLRQRRNAMTDSRLLVGARRPSTPKEFFNPRAVLDGSQVQDRRWVYKVEGGNSRDMYMKGRV